MTTKTVATQAAYAFVGYYFVEQSQQLLLGKKLQTGDRPVEILWDWRRVSERGFEVKLGVNVEAAKEIPERLNVVLVGRFSCVGPGTTSESEEFASINAVAILLPYVREALSSLSGRGPFGAYVLQPINVVEMAKSFDLKRATAARRLPQQKKKAITSGRTR